MPGEGLGHSLPASKTVHRDSSESTLDGLLSPGPFLAVMLHTPATAVPPGKLVVEGFLVHCFSLLQIHQLARARSRTRQYREKPL